jgi:hypothetical protein
VIWPERGSTVPRSGLASTGAQAGPSNSPLTVCYCLAVLPELTADGELPPGVHIADWREFQSRFCGSSPRRIWLAGRFRAPVELAATSGKLRRVFVWGSFVTSKLAPRDIDILPIMDEDFETGQMSASAQAVFDSVRAKLLFEIRRVLVAGVHWGRNAESLAGLRGLDTYQISRSFRKRGIVEVITP